MLFLLCMFSDMAFQCICMKREIIAKITFMFLPSNVNLHMTFQQYFFGAFEIAVGTLMQLFCIVLFHMYHQCPFWRALYVQKEQLNALISL